MPDVQKILNERGKTHGDYAEMCNAIQATKRTWREQFTGKKALTNAQWETLDSIALKVGRILTGDANFQEHWLDIAGYATRMAEQLEQTTRALAEEQYDWASDYKLVKAEWRAQNGMGRALEVVAWTQFRVSAKTGRPKWASVAPSGTGLRAYFDPVPSEPGSAHFTWCRVDGSYFTTIHTESGSVVTE